MAGRDKLEAGEGPLSEPAEPTSEISAGLPVEIGQAPIWPSILRWKAAKFFLVWPGDRRPDGGNPVTFRYAGDRGILCRSDS